MAAHIKKIHAANEGLGIRVLAGAEIDILKDGSLDYSEEILAQLDVVVCSIRSYFNIDRAAMTERMLAAMQSREFRVATLRCRGIGPGSPGFGLFEARVRWPAIR
jgi:histidinol phosphatase-like PHP family hydrolase